MGWAEQLAREQAESHQEKPLEVGPTGGTKHQAPAVLAGRKVWAGRYQG